MYLLNYSVYKPPDSWKATHKSFLDNSVGCGVSIAISIGAQMLSNHARLPGKRVWLFDFQCHACQKYWEKEYEKENCFFS